MDRDPVSTEEALDGVSEERRSSAVRASPSETAPLVLVVDDEAALRQYLQESLEPSYRVRKASGAEDALDALREERPDLVICDIHMPGPSGFDVCESIRSDPDLQSVPVILLTVEPEERGQMKGLRSGADAYVNKPFKPDELRQRVENLIEVRRYLRRDKPASTERAATSSNAPVDAEPTADGAPTSTGSLAPNLDSEGSRSSFEEEVQAIIKAHIDNSNFGVDWLADEVDLSSRHLQRKIQEKTGLSAAAYIRAVRLQHAANLLERKEVGTVSDAADAVGYRDPSHFSRIFREAFGTSPSEYTGDA
jgi:DNA-binding response OmpR family regulator